MRILDQSKVMIQLEQLGMLPQALERFTKAFSQAHGAVLVTGPTGSGKSTSLYGALNQLNTSRSTSSRSRTRSSTSSRASRRSRSTTRRA